MDDEHSEVADMLVEEYGEAEIMAGLALVASFLRDALRHHAEQLGCNCGSTEWLDEAVAHAAMGEHDDG